MRGRRKEITAIHGLRNDKKGVGGEEGSPDCFLPTLEFPVCVTFRSHRAKRSFYKTSIKDWVLIEHAEGIPGEKGECFAGKAELE